MLPLLFCALVSVTTADLFIWNGGTTNFSDSRNWQNGLIPSPGRNGCATSFGVAGKAIISQLDVRFL